MKFLHLSDFHIGKVISGEDISPSIEKGLDQSIKVMEEENIKTLVMSGDIFNEDPTTLGKEVFKSYIDKLIKNKITGLFIFGNHDKLENIPFDLEDLKRKNIYIVTSLNDFLTPIKIDDVNFYLLPYCSKKEIKKLCPELSSDIKANDAFSYLLNKKLKIDDNDKNVLVYHNSIKKLDVNDVFKHFDYVALGHIHHIENVTENIRYSGSIIEFNLRKLTSPRKFTIVDTDNFKVIEKEYSI